MKKKRSLFVVGAISFVLILLLIGSFVNSLFVYMMLMFLALLIVMNILSIDKIEKKLSQETEKAEEEPEKKKEEKKVLTKEEIIPTETPNEQEQKVPPEIIEKANKVAAYIRENLEKGHNINKIVDTLVSAGWSFEFVQQVMIGMGILKVKEPFLPEMEEKTPVKKKQKK